MTAPVPDVIDLLAGIRAGSFVDRIRAQRPETRANAQKSYLALFEPTVEGDITRTERLAIAVFVTALHGASAASEFYAAGIGEVGGAASLLAAIKAEVARGRTDGPYGHYPQGPLTVEDRPGPLFEVSEFGRVALGAKLSAALEHSHLLVYRPRESSPVALQKLIDAGWSATGIVTLSQIIAFLSFQVRVIAALAALDQAGQGSLVATAAE
jgi:CMD domain protein